ncbi:39015_t:CDS:2 [Gigaspora margarita]|uniref:39015_t:CDS:1 n=1 Tax=Gigaspora margarita TaxID=4874 RepID=A0ABN7ULB9_GIGMA|nr:39015_t:CDS:2 [Gigaspora margarita]
MQVNEEGDKKEAKIEEVDDEEADNKDEPSSFAGRIYKMVKLGLDIGEEEEDIMETEEVAANAAESSTAEASQMEEVD